MIVRLWLAFCVVWAVDSFAYGTYTGPGMFNYRIIQAAMPLILGMLLMPILQALNFRKAYREAGRAGIYMLAVQWGMTLFFFLAPAVTLELGFPQLSKALAKVLWMYIASIAVLVAVFGPLIVIAFKVLRWLVRALFPQLFPAGSRYTHSLEP